MTDNVIDFPGAKEKRRQQIADLYMEEIKKEDNKKKSIKKQFELELKLYLSISKRKNK